MGVVTVMITSIFLSWEQSGISQGKAVLGVWGYPVEGWWGAPLSIYTEFSLLVTL